MLNLPPKNAKIFLWRVTFKINFANFDLWFFPKQKYGSSAAAKNTKRVVIEWLRFLIRFLLFLLTKIIGTLYSPISGSEICCPDLYIIVLFLMIHMVSSSYSESPILTGVNPTKKFHIVPRKCQEILSRRSKIIAWGSYLRSIFQGGSNGAIFRAIRALRGIEKHCQSHEPHFRSGPETKTITNWDHFWSEVRDFGSVFRCHAVLGSLWK